ncbi:hypothetical protein MRY87_05185 [bacterium]|nr:hypothetical protein [bacterium]
MEILPQLLVNALITGSIYALASSGLSLTYGLLKILNFAHGHLMMVGAYLFYLASVTLGFGLVGSAFFTVGAMTILSVLSLQLFVTPFLKLNLFLVFVTTLALSTILESRVSKFFWGKFKAVGGGIAI